MSVPQCLDKQRCKVCMLVHVVHGYAFIRAGHRQPQSMTRCVG